MKSTDQMKVLKELEKLREENKLLKNELAINKLLYQDIGKVGHWINDIRDNSVFWSDHIFEIFGYAVNELSPYEIFSKHLLSPDRERYWEYLNKSLDSGELKLNRIEISVSTKNGDIRHLNIEGRIQLNDKGEKSKVIGTIQDVTEIKDVELELKQSKERFEDLFKNMGEAFALHEIITNKNGEPTDYRFLEINPSFEKLTGLKKDKVIGKTVLSLMPNTEKYWIETYGKVALTGVPIQFTNYAAELNHYYEVKCYAPRIGLFAVIFNDITERIKAEKEQKDSEERFRLIIEFAADAVFLSDMKGRIVNVNKKACENLGYTKEELMAMTVMELDSDYPTLDQCLILWNGIKPNETESFESWHRRKNNTIFPVETNVSSIDIKGVKHILGFVRDISQRKDSEKQIRKLSTAVIQSPVAIVITDPEGNIEYVNPQFTRVTEYEYNEALGQNPRILKTDYTPPENYTHMWNTIKSGEIWSGEFLNKKKNGDTFWELATIAPITDKNGDIISFVAIKEDITRRKMDEEALKKSEQELKQANATKNRFFSIIAHDLKNPIGSIMSFGELINNSLMSENYTAVKCHVNVLLESAERTYSLLINLLEWARFQTDNIRFVKEEINIHSLIEDNIYLLQGNAKNKKIKIKNMVEPNLTISADLQMIDTVVRNLVSNAIKFTDIEGSVIIESKKEREKAIISVSDSGIGIEPERIPKIFEVENNKSTPGTQNESGTGLGLMLCKDFIQRHNGEIWVESILNKGSVFHFSIPII